MCSHGTKAPTDEPVGLLVRMTIVIVFFILTTWSFCFVLFLSIFLPKNVLDEAIKMSNFIKSRYACWQVKYFRGMRWARVAVGIRCEETVELLCARRSRLGTGRLPRSHLGASPLDPAVAGAHTCAIHGGRIYTWDVGCTTNHGIFFWKAGLKSSSAYPA